MKKVLALILALAMMFVLCGCGKSEAAKQVEEMIDAIGEVAVDSGRAISDARNSYEQLSEKEQKQVSNLSVLEEAEDRYASLVEDHYDQALSLAGRGKYNEAAEMFGKISDYRDSRAMAEKCEEAAEFIDSNTYKMILSAASKFPATWSIGYEFDDHAVVILCDFTSKELPNSSSSTKAWASWDKLLTSFVDVSGSTQRAIAKGGFPNIGGVVRVRNSSEGTIIFECKNGETVFDNTH